MRSQEEMLAIILKKAKQEEHIRAALLQGSRVSKEAKPDCFQDYDVVFLVDAVEPFLSNPRWIDCFGRRIIMQIPEPPTRTRMTYLMQFADGNRIDLTLVSRDARDTDPRVCGMVLDKDDFFLPRPKEDPFW
ncbi:MAG: aminoglycoside 6-adenylyltransferase [[Clostridium] leptum]